MQTDWRGNLIQGHVTPSRCRLVGILGRSVGYLSMTLTVAVLQRPDCFGEETVYLRRWVRRSTSRRSAVAEVDRAETDERAGEPDPNLHAVSSLLWSNRTSRTESRRRRRNIESRHSRVVSPSSGSFLMANSRMSPLFSDVPLNSPDTFTGNIIAVRPPAFSPLCSLPVRTSAYISDFQKMCAILKCASFVFRL